MSETAVAEPENAELLALIDEHFREFKEGSIVNGTILDIRPQVVVVDIGYKSEGAIPVSEFEDEDIEVGDEVEVMVLDIDEERRRISLGIKQCKGNPWEDFSALHAKGDRIKGYIKSITDFGIFIGLDGNIDGLVHLSDISWNEPGEQAVRRFTKGDEIETVILSIDAGGGDAND